MAEDIKSSKDSKNRLSDEGEIVDTMRQQLDLTKQIRGSYDDILTKINRSKEALDKIKGILKEQQDEYSKNKLSIENINKALLDTTAQIGSLKQEQLANNAIIKERQALLQEEAVAKEKLAKIEKEQLRNSGAQLANTQALIDVRKTQTSVQDKFKQVEEEIAEAQRAAIHDGIVDQSKYNGLLQRHEYLSKKITELKQTETGYVNDAARLAKRGIMLDDERFRKNDKLQEVQKKLVAGAEEYAIAEKNSSAIAVQLDVLGRNGKKLSEEKNSLSEKNVKILEKIKSLRKSEQSIVENIKALDSMLILANIVMLAYDRFVKLDKAAEDFRKITGFSADQMRDLRSNAEAVNRKFQDMGVSMEVVYKSATALVDVFGRTTLITKESLENVSLLSANLGVAEADSAKVLANFQGLGGATEKAAMNVIKVGAGISEKAGVPFKMVMQDVANASDDTLNLIGATPNKLMKSAIAARALGTDINKIAATQQKLLNYSSSITSELEASALLGRSISFQKARQLAYDGDAIGAAKATLDTIKKAGDFNKMTVYQKKALAEASGMELKDITKMMAVEKQRDAILLNGTEEQKKKLLEQEAELENLKKMADLDNEDLARQNEKAIRQQKIQGLMTNMRNTIESMVIALQDVFEPIVRVAAGVLIPVFKIIAAFVRGLLTPLHNIGKALLGNAEGAKKVGAAFDAIGTFMVKVYEAAEKLGEIVGSILYPAMQIYGVFSAIAGPIAKVAKFTSDIAKYFDRVATAVTFFSNGLTGVFAIFRPIANAVAMVSRGLSFVAKFAGPIGLIITAIQVVVDYISQMVDIWTSDDMDIGEKILMSLAAIPKALYNVMVKPFIDAIDWVLEYFGINFSVGEFFKEWVSGMMSLGTMMIQPLVNSMYELWEAVTNIFDGKDIGMNILKGLWSVGKLITQALFWPFTAAWGLISGWLGQSPSELGEAIVTGIKAVAGFVLDALTWPFRTAMNFVSGLFGGEGELGTTIVDGVKKAAGFIIDVLTTPFRTVMNILSTLFEGGGEFIPKLLDGIKSAASLIFDVLTYPFRNIMDFVSGLFGGDGQLGTTIIEGIKNVASLIFDIIVSPFKKAIDFVKGLPLVGKLFGGADDISKQASPTSSAQSVQASNVVEVAHLDELRDVVMELTTAVANLGTAVTTTPASGTTLNTSGLEAKLDNLTQLLVGGAVRVYLDGKDVSAAMSSTGR